MDRSPVSTAGVPGLSLAVVLVSQVPVKVLVRVHRISLAGGGGPRLRPPLVNTRPDFPPEFCFVNLRECFGEVIEELKVFIEPSLQPGNPLTVYCTQRWKAWWAMSSLAGLISRVISNI